MKSTVVPEEKLQILDRDNHDHYPTGKLDRASLLLATTANGKDAFAIVPRASNLPSILYGTIFLLAIVLAISFGLNWLFPAVPVSLICIVGAMATLLMAWYSYRAKRKSLAKGPWLVYDKVSKRVELPRDQVSFALDEVIYLQQVRGPLPPGVKDTSDDGEHSELHLITQQDDQRKRWQLQDIQPGDIDFEDLLIPLLEHTPIPVVQIRERWIDGVLSMRTFAPRKSQFSLRSLLIVVTFCCVMAGLIHWTGPVGTFALFWIAFGLALGYRGQCRGLRSEMLWGAFLILFATGWYLWIWLLGGLDF